MQNIGQDCNKNTGYARWLLIGLLLALAILCIRKPTNLVPTLVGIDFSQYWAGGQAVVLGQNQYDGEILAPIQKQGWQSVAKDPDEIALLKENTPVMNWTPPHSFAITGLFSLPKYQTAFYLFLLLNLSLFIFFIATILHLPNHPLWRVAAMITILLTSISIPDGLRAGQITGIIAFGYGLMLIATYSTKDIGWRSTLAGVGIALTSIKPHLLYIPYTIITILSAPTLKPIKVFTVAVGSVAILSLPAIFFRPTIWQDYLTAMQDGGTKHWITVTLGSILRTYFGPEKLWLSWICVAITLSILTLMLKALKKLSLHEQILLMTPLSLFTAPYGWLLDQTLTIPTLVWAVSIAVAGRHYLLLSGLIALHIGTMFAKFPFQHHYVYYPPVLFMLTLILVYLKETQKQNDVFAA